MLPGKKMTSLLILTELMLAMPAAAPPQVPPQAPTLKETPAQAPPVKAEAFPTAEPGGRVRYAGYWWDTLPGGRLRWCTECNGPYPTGGIPGLMIVGASGVPAPRPFPVNTPATIVPPAGGFDTSWRGPDRRPEPTPTGVRLAVRVGGINPRG